MLKEHVSLRVATEMIEALWWKFRFLGVPIDGPVEVFCEHKLVVNNLSLNIRDNDIWYHRSKEDEDSCVILFGRIPNILTWRTCLK